MTFPGVYITGIDWSATGAWFSGFATLAGVFVAYRAMKIWKEQIRLQDRYTKADALLRSITLCVRAGHDWLWSCGRGENFDALKDSDEYRSWKMALMDYRLNWDLAQTLFVEDQLTELNANPNVLQSKVITAGRCLTDAPNGYLSFVRQLDEILDGGAKEIAARREGKF
jgi:hypothetical protein